MTSCGHVSIQGISGYIDCPVDAYLFSALEAGLFASSDDNIADGEVLAVGNWALPLEIGRDQDGLNISVISQPAKMERLTVPCNSAGRSTVPIPSPV